MTSRKDLPKISLTYVSPFEWQVESLWLHVTRATETDRMMNQKSTEKHLFDDVNILSKMLLSYILQYNILNENYMFSFGKGILEILSSDFSDL